MSAAFDPFNLDVKVGGRFIALNAVHKDTGEVRQLAGEFDNLVLDSGLQRMGAGAWINSCIVGSGNSEPNIGQQALDNFVARTTAHFTYSNGVQTSTAPYYWWARVTYRFAAGAAAGNLSEIGVGWSNTGLWNRTLIKDLNGDPTTITVRSDEYLDVIFELRVYPNMDDVVKTITYKESVGDELIDISTHTVTIRPVMTGGTVNIYSTGSGNQAVGFWGAAGSTASSQIRYCSGALNAITVHPGNQFANSSCTTLAYQGDLKRSGRSTLNLTTGNGSQRCLRVDTSIADFKFEYDPPIVKTSDMELTHNFSMSWGRYTPPSP